MSTAESPERRRSWLRQLPLVLGLLSLVAIGVIWALPGEQPERGTRMFASIMTGVGATVFIALWFLLQSGWPWVVRLLPVVLLAALVGSVRDVQFTGDMQPSLEFRWQTRQEEIVRAARAQQAKAVGEVDLTKIGPRDWPAFRGQQRDGVVQGFVLNTNWNDVAPKELWRQPCGLGYAAFAVVGKWAVTIEQRGDKEAVVCYDADTGAERWVYEQVGRFSEPLGGDGPRATPTIADGNVYALGATGRLVCLDSATGTEKWTANILENNENLDWGMAGSPLVYDDVVVVTPGAQTPAAKGRAILAYECQTGKLKWAQGDHKGGYSSPQLATLLGERQLVLFDGVGIAGYDPEGKGELWRFPWPVNMDINVAQPLVIGTDQVFISSGYGVGCALLQVSKTDGKWSVDQLWKNTSMKCKFTSPVVAGPYIFGLDEGVLTCLLLVTGDRQWREGRYGHGQILLAGQHIVVMAENGKVHLVPATGGGTGSGSVPTLTALKKGSKTWNPPALANGRLYLRNHEEMVCFEVSGREVAPGPATLVRPSPGGVRPAGPRTPPTGTPTSATPTAAAPAAPTPTKAAEAPATGDTPNPR
ncbi:MAG TPA: PQQ-like beta-propeller repeat protein [Gemmatales bacterium]|nr:PQQ-like beta-propeller repeat protein [Gemmatales bacterium]